MELGTSAGLNLLWDQYSYTYEGDTAQYGAKGSPVQITSSFRGERPRELVPGALLPEISHRIGLDLNIVDTHDSDEVLWLNALIWPEHQERRELLTHAIDVRNAGDLDLREGDAVLGLRPVLAEIPHENVACVFHTHVANQLPAEARRTLLEELAEMGAGRDLVHLCNNIRPRFHLTAWCDGIEIDYPLAQTEGHARWIEWLHHD